MIEIFTILVVIGGFCSLMAICIGLPLWVHLVSPIIILVAAFGATLTE